MSDEILDGIAIVGMSGRFPGSPDIEAFWQSLLAGTESIAPFTDAELIEAGIPADVLAHPNYVKAGSVIDAVEWFDAAFFGISPREAETMDPQQRLFLEQAWLALEDAGIVPSRFAGQIAVFGGASFSTYGLLNLRAEIGSSGALETVLGNDKDYLATRVSYKLGLRGPSVAVQTACSTSLTAVAMACDSLLNRQADVALAGGVTVKLPLKSGYLYEEGSILSPDGHCRTFDARAQGTIFGSGVGVVALKRLEDAVADGDPIHALIRGWSVNNDGDHKVGFTAPSVDGQARVIAAALAQAGVKPDTIGYVEAHGTATPIGDPIEVRALTRAYGDGSRRSVPCGIGSVKTNVGHLESAAGITGLIKAVLSVKHGTIPPSLHFETPNPDIDFARSPFRVVDRLTPWCETGGPRRAGVNSFGMGGTNVHVIVEEPPARPAEAPKRPPDERPCHLVTLSARTRPGLRETALRLAAHIAGSDGLGLEDLAHTLAARQHFPVRLAVRARKAGELETALRGFAAGTAGDALQGDITGRAPPGIAFLLTGQGTQYAGMGRELFDTAPRFRRTIERCDAILRPLLPRPLLSVLFPGPGDEGLVDETVFTQPALFSLSYALADLWRSWGVEPALLLGHSVGEYAAAAIASVFSLEDGLELIAARGRLMQALPRDGAMMTIFADEATVRAGVEREGGALSIAAVNGPANSVISGRRTAVERLAAEFEARGIEARPLATSHAFHSPLMRPMLEAYAEVVGRVRLHPPGIPIVSNVTGRPERDLLAEADYWSRHILAPVRFRAGITAAIGAGARIFVELGPRPALCGLGREAAAGLTEEPLHWLPSLAKTGKDWATMLEALGRLYTLGVPIDWAQFGAEHEGRRVRLPGYAFQRRRFWTAPPARAAGDGRVRGVASGESHPLLGQRLRQAGTTDQRFEAALSAQAPAYLDHHRVFEAAVLPAAAYLDMALAGGARLLSSDDLMLEDIAFKQAMILPPGQERIVQTLFTPGSAQDYRFQVFSGDEGGDSWTLHCTGSVLRAPAPEAVEDLAAARARCADPLPVDFVYENYRARGLDYGPAFRGLRAVSAGTGETVASIVLPEAARDGHAYRLHPALMDACFQALGAAFGARQDRDTFLPVMLRRLVLRAPVPTGIWCHARLETADDAEAADRISTLHLFDEDGRLVAQADGLQSRRVTRDVVLGDDAEPLDSWLYDLAWDAAPPVAASARLGSGTWAILAPAGPVGGEICAAITARGGHAIRIASEDDGTRLAETLRAAGPLAGILDLRALADDGRDVPERAEAATVDLLRLAQAMIAAGSGAGVALVVLTRAAQGGIADDLGADHRGLAGAPLWGLLRTLWHECPAMPCLGIDLDPHPAAGEAERIVDELASVDTEQQVAFRDGRRFLARLRPHQAERGRLDLPATPYRIDKAPEYGLDRLEVLRLVRRPPGAGEVELEVVGMGLNFRDVLNAMGLYPGDAGPFGGECSGRVLRTGSGVSDLRAGDEVVALHYGTFASHVTLPAAVVFRAPKTVPLVEAAGLPIVYLTAWYGLHHLARIKAGDRVLIHSGTGGVGVAAIRIAQRAGAEIFATSSPHKHDTLRGLGIAHAMNSRNLDFADRILELTGGRGVDIVLNSLGGEAIPASLNIVAPGGRFVEIGKRDIWSLDQARALRPDIDYSIVNFDKTAVEEPELVRALMAEALGLVSSGALGPPLTSVYPAARALDAMRLMQKANHVGKLVLAAPVPGATRGDIRPDATYLITGAFGGLGQLVTGWLAQQGARHLALVGRHAPEGDAAGQVEALRAAGIDVKSYAADIGDRAALDGVLASIEGAMRPLRGIIHTAGVLDDGVVTALDPQRVKAVFAGKVAGAWHLHEATRTRDLDLFVLFSSLGSVLGAPGQANYAAANAFLDALSHRRRALRLPALTINWGGWSDIGMSRGRAVAAQLSQGGGIEAAKGLRVLGQLIRESDAAVSVVPFAWRLYFEGLPRRLSLLSDVERDLERQAADAQIFTRLRASLRSADTGRRDAELITYLGGIIARLLQLDTGDAIAPARPLVELGLDSLVSIQLRNRIRAELEIDLPVAEMIQAGTLAQLVAVIGAKLTPGADPDPAAGAIPRLGLREAPLSFAQQRLWFLTQLDPHSAFYTVTFSLFIEGTLDPLAFEAAFEALTRRHDTLRTRIGLVAGQPVQRIAAEGVVPIEAIDLSGLPEAERTPAMERRVAIEAARTFDLAEGPLVRVTLLKLGAALHRAVIAMHHIVTDGWSAVVLTQEFGALYRAIVAARPLPLTPLPIQYGDFAAWQRDRMEGEAFGRAIDYWSRTLAGPLRMRDLASDRPRTTALTHRGEALSVMLPRSLADDLTGLSRSLGTGLFATLLGAFKILLHRLTGAEDLCVGSLVANRDRPEIEGLVGFFSNLVVFRADLSGDPPVRDMLAREAQVVREGLAHQEVPFDKLVEVLKPAREPGRNPFCDMVFILQRSVPAADLEAEGLRIGPVWDLDNGTVRFDLEVHVWDTDRGLSCSFIYNADLFDRATIVQFERQFALVLQGIVDDPLQPLSRIALSAESDPPPADPARPADLAEALSRVESMSDEEVEALLLEMSGEAIGGAR